MLGKGLESLIPQKGSQPSTPQESQSVPPSNIEPAILQSDEPKISTATNAPIGIGHPIKPAAYIDNTAPKKRSEAIFHIEIDKVKPNPHQPRKVFDEESLKDLAASIREFGVIQPIVVSKIERESDTGTTVEYELIAGERRLIASKLAGLSSIPAIIRESSTARAKLEVAIIENIQRTDLNSIEKAKAFARLQDEFGLTQREIAVRLGKSREVVANTVRLLNLPSEVQEALAAGRINESQGRLLLSVGDIGRQREIFEDIVRDNLSVREIQSRVYKLKTEVPKAASVINPEMESIRERLEELLGTKVDVKNDDGKAGKIMINFYSEEELRGIIDKLMGNSSTIRSDNQLP